jgi:hypothetical protein
MISTISPRLKSCKGKELPPHYAPEMRREQHNVNEEKTLAQRLLA